MPNDDQSDAPVNKRERSPSFPYIDLAAALEYAKRIYKAAKMNDVRISDVAAAWGMAANSGSFMRYVAALGQFGLIDSAGSSENRKIKLSVQGRRILEDDRPGVRQKLLSEAALQPKIIRGLFLGEEGMPHWGKDRPTDSIAESTLKFDLDFSAEASRRFLLVYDSTIKHVVTTGDETSKEVEPLVGQALDSEEDIQEQKFGREEDTKQEAPKPSSPTELNKINFRSEGQGVIYISATIDAEGLELLEKKIAAFKILLG
jgi:hypothetical protein